MSDAEFLSVAEQFRLGMLDTERPHPETGRLSEWAKNDLNQAFGQLKQVDIAALKALERKLDLLQPLANTIRQVLDRGNSIYLCGCGATGRLSISLEVFARNGLLDGANQETVVGFMAGGDAALIRSIESFEDRPEYGERQLQELGFAEGDLLIASTEGGETPFVIGATEAAIQLSAEKPFFLYCNPDDLLCQHVERSKKVIENDRICKINLAVGPMALSGSTRMQASTVLMTAIGLAMKHSRCPGEISPSFSRLRRFIEHDLDYLLLKPFTEAESGLYREGEFVVYRPGPFGLTVLTDTTERSPTFTLTPFEREHSGDRPSLCYLWIEGTASSSQAWQHILNRDPNPVEWGTLRHLTSGEAMRPFNFSDSVHARRETLTGKANHLFSITETGEGIQFSFCGLTSTVQLPAEFSQLERNLILKILLNAHSTLVMGRMGRYEGNVMTYVSANNNKLIDRAIRYVDLLLNNQYQISMPYEQIATVLLEEKAKLSGDEPIVLKTLQAILERQRQSK